MTYTQNGSDGNDNIFIDLPGQQEVEINLLAGSDYLQIDADLLNSSINGNTGNDVIVSNSTEIQNTSVYGGAGNDKLYINTQSATGDQFWGDGGNDLIILSSLTADAAYSKVIVKADGTSPAADGTDVVYIDESVKSFNGSLVDLGGNDTSVVGQVVDAAVDYFLNLNSDGPFDLTDIVSLGVEAVIVEAQEVSKSTFFGGKGDDVFFFNGLEGNDSTAFNRSVAYGNEGQDVFAWARNLDQTSIYGGKGDDYIIGLSGITLNSEINGNQGADTLILLDLELKDSSIYGGKGDDSINVAALEAIDTLISGDFGDDKINFAAVQSIDTTLSGGIGADEIDDYSGFLRNIGNYLSGGAGDDTLRQASGILFAGITQFLSTMDGGTGSDTMTGDSTTQTFGPKGYNEGVFTAGKVALATPDMADLNGVSSDLFVFAFGDSVINSFGVGLDTITDFDSNSSFYRNVAAPLTYDAFDANGKYWDLGRLQRDQIQLDDENGDQYDITVGAGGRLKNNDIYSVNSNGLVTGGVDNISEFIEAGAQQLRGEALIWTENNTPFPGKTVGSYTPENGILSYLFISDGDAGLTTGDLLVALDNVGQIDATGGLQLTNGKITDIMTATVFAPSLPLAPV